MELVRMIQPTSKAALKQQCLFLCNLDIEKAEKMYDFLIKDMEELPAMEPETQSFIQNFGNQANGVIAWLRENKDVLGDGVNFVRDLIAARKGGAAVPANPLPIINQ